MQASRTRRGLRSLRRSRRRSANCEFHLPDGYVMQRASLPEPPNNLLIISRNLDDVYSRKQLGTARRRNQIFNVVGDLLLIRFMIATKQCGFVFRQRGNRKRRLARSRDVVQPDELEEVCR